MSLRAHILLILLIPALLFGGLILTETKLPIPQWGRDYVLRLLMPELAEELELPDIYGPDDPNLPLVVIDAGHGGRDPGAVGAGIREKDITLDLALRLRDELVRQGGARVALTREDDRLLALEERPDLARRMEADLFFSIHADSAGEKSGVSGASIYTLSTRASSAAAARFARKENNADRLNGLSIDGQSDEVSTILVELSQRRSQAESREFADLVAREGDTSIQFHEDTLRSADLVVLRTPDMPSVLFEAGFVTNAEDAARLSSTEWQSQFAAVTARAIRAYFVRRQSN